MFNRTTARTSIVAASLALALGVAGCSSTDSSEGSTSSKGATVANGDQSTVSIGVHSGWDEGIAVSHLFKVILEEEGYTVETTEADAGIVYTGLTGGDFDINFDMWLPVTHAQYLETYGDEMEQLGAWYDNAKLTIAVNEDSPATSLADLAANADAYGNRLVGIEAGAGLTSITEDKVVPTYGLEDMDYLISSTPAMLAELKGATAAGNNIAVTLWRPHWAYDEFPVRDLEDPEGALGEAEEINSVGRLGFTEDFPTLSSWVSAFTLTDEQLFSLENIMFNENDGADNDASARTWLDQNPTFVDDLKAAATA
ncbi:glycine betaine ABC transporter substrate-binding protein [Sanguibacter suarezii]|uniref:glycine betaine ABC transporter substrate-binding protein n=1 Tax=Sanguibacter suarezii TaxID=60921 RepID=UPI000832C5DB|nr:glycine betaine ABC transporter substrate-binding protein [Sanguibacter suarezii]